MGSAEFDITHMSDSEIEALKSDLLRRLTRRVREGDFDAAQHSSHRSGHSKNTN